MHDIAKINSTEKKSRDLLYVLVTLLVFEGIMRKFFSFLNIPLFFLKDVLCIYAIYLVNQNRGIRISFLNSVWNRIAVSFIPLILYTAIIDPIMGLFGAKQYLLYIVIGILVPIAFPSDRLDEFKRFFAFAAFLIIPTSVIAILQNSLPPSHWINLSVDGGSLENFSAAGFLRVSSTFSFTGQYSYFLNASCAFFAIRLFMPPSGKVTDKSKIKKIIPYILGIMLLIGAFITGGRTAVLGCGGCLLVGTLLLTWKNPQLLGGTILSLVLLFAGYYGAKAIAPGLFAAYDQRSTGTLAQSQSDEISDRLLGGFIGWTDWFVEQDIPSIALGNGLGVMANGSDRISSYAAKVRAGGHWTETDMPTTAWEGGIYLLALWYLFRLWVIYSCFRIWNSLESRALSSAAGFIFGFVLINGLIGTLSIQPPLAIWWWLSVGSLIAFQGFDKNRNLVKL